MRALISGQAGIAILLDENITSIIRFEDPDHAIPCQATDLLWLLADADDVVEFSEIGRSEVVDRLSTAWKRDRTLQLMLALTDSTLPLAVRQKASDAVDSAFQDQDNRDFVSHRLYAAPLRSNLDGMNYEWFGTESRLRLFLEELNLHQNAISVSRGAWNSLPPRLFVDLIVIEDRRGSRTDLALQAKAVVERALIEAGTFQLVARSIHAGTPPFSSSDIDSVLQDKRLVPYRPVLEAVLNEWVEACGPRAQALLKVALLGVPSCLKLKRYAQTLVNWLEDKARGRSHWDLLRDAAVRALVEHKPQEDFEAKVQRTLGDVASEWFKEAELDPVVGRESREVWKALAALSPSELLKLKNFAKWRIRGLGRKARGHEAKDLLDEAIAATAMGKRAWRQTVSLYTHILGAMQSISDSWRQRVGEEYLESEVTSPEGKSPMEEAATNLDPERILEAKQRLEQVRNLFVDDSQASQVLELFGEGWSADEVQAKLKISEKEFGAVTKRIRRKLNSWQREQGAA